MFSLIDSQYKGVSLMSPLCTYVADCFVKTTRSPFPSGQQNFEIIFQSVFLSIKMHRWKMMMSLHRIKFLMDFHLFSSFQFLWLHRALHIQPFTDTFILYVIYIPGATCSASAATLHTLTTTHSGAISGSVSHNNDVKTTYLESKSRLFERNKNNITEYYSKLKFL